jgi:hypothetical protein
MSFHGPIIDFFQNTPSVIMGLIAGLTAVAVHYRKTGRLPLGRLPWASIRRSVHFITSEYFTRSRPSGVPGLVTDASPKEIEEILREGHYESGDLYSFQYSGEVLNLRRPSALWNYKNEPVAMEVHARVFETDDGRSFIIAHHEASRYEEWKEHIRGSVLSWKRGREHVKRDLAGVAMTPIESEDTADFEVVS